MRKHPNPFQDEERIRTAWYAQAAEASRIPFLARLFAESGNDLFPRFAESYEQLKSLPRRARRSLQRQLARSCRLPHVMKVPSGRALHHKLAWSIAGAALLLALGQEVQAANITVTTKNPHFVPGDGHCSLSEAIVAANIDAAYDGCAAGSGADTINLPSGTHNIKVPLVPYYVAFPPITTQVTITGAGNGSKISRPRNAPAAALLVTTNTGNLTLNNITLQGGYGFLTGGIGNYGGAVYVQSNSKITKNRGYIVGGGVFNSGYLYVGNSKIEKNYGFYAGGGILDAGGLNFIYNSTVAKNTAGFYGGGISNYGFSYVSNSTITGNVAGTRNTTFGVGAGMLNNNASYIVNSVISKNQTKATYGGPRPGFGGGLANYNGFIVGINNTIEKNKADIGAGLYSYYGGYSIMVNSTISQNQARTRFFYYSYGGGVLNVSGGVSLHYNNTISSNKADYGAGIGNFYFGGSGSINSTITKNSAKRYGGGIYNSFTSPTVLRHTLVSGNKVPRSGFGPEISNYGYVGTNFYNLFGQNGSSGATNVVVGAYDYVPAAGIKSTKVVAPQLKDNGGPPNASGSANKTHALVLGSPAIDFSPGCIGALATDERGIARPVGAGCDIGAFEGPP